MWNHSRRSIKLGDQSNSTGGDNGAAHGNIPNQNNSTQNLTEYYCLAMVGKSILLLEYRQGWLEKMGRSFCRQDP